MNIDELRKAQRLALNKLLSLYGYSKQNMAVGLGVKPNVVYGWFGRGRISAHMAIKAEVVTGGGIKKQELRPDVLEWVIEE